LNGVLGRLEPSTRTSSSASVTSLGTQTIATTNCWTST